MQRESEFNRYINDTTGWDEHKGMQLYKQLKDTVKQIKTDPVTCSEVGEELVMLEHERDYLQGKLVEFGRARPQLRLDFENGHITTTSGGAVVTLLHDSTIAKLPQK